MSDPMRSRVDNIVEDEVRQGKRVMTLPEDVLAILKEDHEVDPSLPYFTHVRFTKLTAHKRRLINEAVVRRYHEDLQNPKLLSQDQLRKLNIERGEWSADTEKRIKDLQSETALLSSRYLADGFDDEAVIDQLEGLAVRFREFVSTVEEDGALTLEQQRVLYEVFVRWIGWNPDRQEDYNNLYAVDQGLPTYNPDTDEQRLIRESPGNEGVEFVLEAGELRDRLIGMRQLLSKRRELLELELKRSQIFRESVENRRDQVDEYARLYYVTQQCDEHGTIKGPLTKTLDEVWSLPEEVLQWLLIEAYMFLNAIPDSARGYLSRLGFLKAPPVSGASQPSDESLAEPSSSSDSPLATVTP